MNIQSKVIVAFSIIFSLLSIVNSMHRMGTFTAIKNKIIQHRNYRDIRNYILPANAYPSVIEANTYRFLDFKNCGLFDFKHCSGNIPTYRLSVDSMLKSDMLAVALTDYLLDDNQRINVSVIIKLDAEELKKSHDRLLTKLESYGYPPIDIGMGTQASYYGYGTNSRRKILAFNNENIRITLDSSEDKDLVIAFAESYQQWLHQQLAHP